MNVNTVQKRRDLARYIEQEIVGDSAVQGIIIIGSIAKGTARADSDIDAVIFLEPFDLYAVPAEAKCGLLGTLRFLANPLRRFAIF